MHRLANHHCIQCSAGDFAARLAATPPISDLPMRARRMSLRATPCGTLPEVLIELPAASLPSPFLLIGDASTVEREARDVLLGS